MLFFVVLYFSTSTAFGRIFITFLIPWEITKELGNGVQSRNGISHNSVEERIIHRYFSRVNELLDCYADRAVRITGIKLRPGAVIMEKLHGAGGLESREPAAERHLRYENDQCNFQKAEIDECSGPCCIWGLA